MATYEQKLVSNNVSFLLIERPIYGSSRIAIDADQKEMMRIIFDIPPVYINRKYYELSNHLGNVISVVSDVKYPVGILGGNIQSFKANIVSYNDYMPFGQPMIGRTFSSEKYRFGFNGKENDNEVKGQGAQQDYGFRIYDPRLGRFLSIDPLTKKYPFWSPFAFAGNSPIYAIDLDGLEIRNAYFNYSSNGTKLELKNPNDKEVADFIDKEIASLMHDDKSLYDYVNQHKVDVDGRELTQSEGFDHLGNITFTATKQDDQALTYQEAYDLTNGEGAFTKLIDSDYDGAEKYRSDYLSGSPTVVKGKLELDAKITVDKNRVDKRNSNALDGNNKSSLLDKVRSGEVLKHEFGHFLYNSKSTDPNTGVINGNSKIDEKEARKIENTFDGEEDTQTNTEDYEPPKK